MTSGQNISHHTTAKLSVNVWNHDLIWWQNKIDTQKHFHKTTITSSWTLSKTKIPITIVKAQMPSNPNQKSRKRDNKKNLLWHWNRKITTVIQLYVWYICTICITCNVCKVLTILYRLQWVTQLHAHYSRRDSVLFAGFWCCSAIVSQIYW